MKSIVIISFIIFSSVNIYGQFNDTSNCNRAVWLKQDTDRIPKSVCITKGYIISYIYEPVDINNDGLSDFIFKWRKTDLNDGDTLFVTVYQQLRDSTYIFLKTFCNLYPLNFRSYSDDYQTNDKRLQLIQKKYRDQYPFLKLTFEKGIIKITRKGDATADMIITYKYNDVTKDWIYDKCEINDFVSNTIEQYDLSDKLGPSIDNFTYFIWE